MNLKSTVRLNNGTQMPKFGLGVFKSKDGEETYQAVRWALEAGYRHIDTAMIYRNESSVGKAIKDSGIDRSDIFVTTKLWNDDMRAGRQEKAIEESLAKLDLEYLDLYLIHWPVAGKYVESWLKMEKMLEKGQTRAIGVSNFHQHHLEDIFAASATVPAVNQIELHPLLPQNDLVNYCESKGIAAEAWSPLGQGKLLLDPILLQIADKYHKTPAQVILRWDIQRNIITIPKSVNKDRIISNAQVFDFELNADDMSLIGRLNTGERLGADPDSFDF